MVSEMILQSLEMLKENPTGGINVKKWMIIIVLLGAVAWVISDFITNSNSDNSTSEEADSESEIEVGLDAGQLAPDFELQTVSGETVRLSDFRGEKVLLNFWATWCPPCKDEMPHFQKYYEKYAKEDNVEIVAVNLTYARETNERVQQFIDSFGITFPVPLMEDEEIGKPYRIVTIPSTFFIDTEGRIQKNIKGPLDADLLRHYVQELD